MRGYHGTGFLPYGGATQSPEHSAPYGGPEHSAPYGGPDSAPYGGPEHSAPYGGPEHSAPYGGPAHSAPYGAAPYGGPEHSAPYGGPEHAARYGAAPYGGPEHSAPYGGPGLAPDYEQHASHGAPDRHAREAEGGAAFGAPTHPTHASPHGGAEGHGAHGQADPHAPGAWTSPTRAQHDQPSAYGYGGAQRDHTAEYDQYGRPTHAGARADGAYPPQDCAPQDRPRASYAGRDTPDPYRNAPPAHPYGNAPPVDPYQSGAPPRSYQSGAPPVDPYQSGAPPVDPYQSGAPPVDPYQDGAPPVDPYRDGASPDSFQSGGPPVDPYQSGAPPVDPYQSAAPPGSFQSGAPPRDPYRNPPPTDTYREPYRDPSRRGPPGDAYRPAAAPGAGPADYYSHDPRKDRTHGAQGLDPYAAPQQYGQPGPYRGQQYPGQERGPYGTRQPDPWAATPAKRANFDDYLPQKPSAVYGQSHTAPYSDTTSSDDDPPPAQSSTSAAINGLPTWSNDKIKDFMDTSVNPADLEAVQAEIVCREFEGKWPDDKKSSGNKSGSPKNNGKTYRVHRLKEEPPFKAKYVLEGKWVYPNVELNCVPSGLTLKISKTLGTESEHYPLTNIRNYKADDKEREFSFTTYTEGSDVTRTLKFRSEEKRKPHDLKNLLQKHIDNLMVARNKELPEFWEQRVAPDSRHYFVNHKTQETIWEDPRLRSL